jgi:hypothetical protein
MRNTRRPATALLAGALCGWSFGLHAALIGTLNPNVPLPQNVNLVFNYSATYTDVSGFGASNLDIVLRPSTARWAQPNSPSTTTGQRYGINIGGAYSVQTLEFIWGTYTNAYLPLTFNFYADSDGVGTLFSAENLIGNQSSAGMTYDYRGTVGMETFGAQRARYDLATPQTVARFGIEVTSWSALGTGSDNRAFLLAASANPTAGTLPFDGEISVFNNTWNPGGTITANHTQGGNIALTPVYETDNWCDPRWWGSYATGNPLTVTQHLADAYLLKAVRWAAGQSNWPTSYQVFAANYDGPGTPGAGDWVAVTSLLNGANPGNRIDFDAPFLGNWVRIQAWAGNTTIWENTKWQVYGSVVPIPEPGTLGLLLSAAAATVAQRRRRPRPRTRV